MNLLVNAVGIKVGGGVTDLRALVSELRKTDRRHRFLFFAAPTQAELGGDLPEHIRWQSVGAGEKGWLRRLWWDQVTLRRWLKHERADVLFSFSDFGMLHCPVPQLLFVRNSLFFSELFQKHILPRQGWRHRLLYRLRRWLVCRSVAAADAVMAPSASMLEMVRRAVWLPDGKATVNYYGRPIGEPAEVPARDYGGPIRLLFPTYYYDYKNFTTALEALRLLRQRHGGRFCLVTTADPRAPLSRKASSTWKQDLVRLEELDSEGAVEVLGLVPHNKLLALYRECHVMCYPTLTESFGHPLVEAMAAGLPVAASDIAINREVARDAVLYFDPLNPAQLTRQVETIVENSDLRATLQERGRRYARGFSWTRHRQHLLRCLEELAGLDKRCRPRGRTPGLKSLPSTHK
ncbi:MAG: glycosyltransferase family 4 protein [Terriglobia bacterium]